MSSCISIVMMDQSKGISRIKGVLSEHCRFEIVVKFATPWCRCGYDSHSFSPTCLRLGRKIGERATAARLQSHERAARTHVSIPHAGFVRLSLARLSLINLFGHTIVRNATGNLIGWKGRTMHRTGGCIAIKREQPSCSRELVLYVFRLSHLISPSTTAALRLCGAET